MIDSVLQMLASNDDVDTSKVMCFAIVSDWLTGGVSPHKALYVLVCISQSNCPIHLADISFYANMMHTKVKEDVN